MQNDVIYDLVEWIESQLTSKLSLDTVAAKSGYSKWYLQRFYHEFTGITLSRYIRLRKLSAAAAELKITKADILYIALKYGFTTQQAFTRSFKDHFHQTPGRYRNKSEWNCSQLYPPYQRINHPITEPDIVALPQQNFTGIQHSFPCIFENLGQFDMEVRIDFFKNHFKFYQELPSYAYGISGFESYGSGNPRVMIKFFTASECAHGSIENNKSREIVIPGGSYAQFNYSGIKTGLQQFIIDVNRYHLPKLGIVRRKGYDIERYFFSDRKKYSLQSSFVQCNYLVPCSDSLHESV
ncbi:TPA: helix-turn-helix domain-containing protein [Klebsiella michiganensis]|nr:helix-turn-helix domain-containing protein [Klebsiella michiganensis]